MFAGGWNKRDVPGQQKDRQPSEDAHHLQQRQRLEVTAGPEQRPARQQPPLCAGEYLWMCGTRCIHTPFYVCTPPSKRGLDRSWLIPAAIRGRAQKEQQAVKAECSEEAELKGRPSWLSPISWPSKQRERGVTQKSNHFFFFFLCVSSWKRLNHGCFSKSCRVSTAWPKLRISLWLILDK